MTTVTLRTDEELLAKANEVLAKRNVSLEDVWEKALRDLAADTRPEGDEKSSVREAMKVLGRIRFDPPYTRDEMHER